MAQGGCKHLLCTQKCLVITNLTKPPFSALQDTYKPGAFNFQAPDLLPGSFWFGFRKGIAVHISVCWQLGLRFGSDCSPVIAGRAVTADACSDCAVEGCSYSVVH